MSHKKAFLNYHSFADAIIALYQTRTDLWARLRVDRITVEKNWLERLMTTLSPGDSILDIGCGNGTPLAPRCIEYGLQVTGIDASPTMIVRCQLDYPELCGQVVRYGWLASVVELGSYQAEALYLVRPFFSVQKTDLVGWQTSPYYRRGSSPAQ